MDSVDGGLVLDTVKLAEDFDTLVLRLYEAWCGRGTAHVRPGLPFERALRASLLEEPLEAAPAADGAIAVAFRPFEIVTLVLG